jgi:hypothetical protein
LRTLPLCDVNSCVNPGSTARIDADTISKSDYSRHFSPMADSSPLWQFDNCLYNIVASEAWAYPSLFSVWVLPRNLISHAGISHIVSSFGIDPPDQKPREISHLHEFVCIPSSVRKIAGGGFPQWERLVHLVFESPSQISVFSPRFFVCSPCLRSIYIPSSVQVIPRYCFATCRALCSVSFDQNCRLTAIEDHAFCDCSSLQSIHIPSSVESLGASCLSCRGLCFVTFAAGGRLSTLEGRVFCACESLRSLLIPATVRKMTGLTFPSCPATIEIDRANCVFSICGDFIVNSELNSLVRYLGSSSEVTIAEGFEQIDSGCFEGHRDLSSVTFGSGSQISVLGLRAFGCCMRLKSIHIPSTVEIIWAACFTHCHLLETVLFESGSRVSIIRERAFGHCIRLYSICLPSSLQTIGNSCFVLCSRLTVVELEEPSQLRDVAKNAFECCGKLQPLPPKLREILLH